MPCYSPVKAYRRESGEIRFFEAPRDVESLELPCGQCVGCRMARASSWAIRCMHEAQLYSRNAFVTLTYDDDHLPQHGSLQYEDVQRFLKRLRKGHRGIEASPSGKYPIRFFVAGEYGSQSWRAHYHMLLFNFDFADKRKWGERTFRSDVLERLWPLGGSLIGSVTPASAAYVARYSLKKVMGRQASEEFYQWTDESTGEVCEVRPEFCVMSRKPGIGSWWLDKYEADVLPRDYVVVNGQKRRVPRYYANRFAKANGFAFEDIQHQRYVKLKDMPLAERSEERRAVQEEVAAARLAHFHGERGL